jgi:hypothetical protein
MTSFWLLVGAGCAACALAGFGAVRIGALLLTETGRSSEPRRGDRPEPRALVFVASAPAVSDTRPETPAARPAVQSDSAPEPTAPRPETEKLVLWALQVKAGERKMSVATDGCRVTWNRTCKHGHPTWLVYLGYL